MNVLTKLARFAVLSRRTAIYISIALAMTTGLARAHEVRPAIADVTVGPAQIEVVLTLSAEAILAGIDLSGVSDTNEAPQAAQYDALRKLSPQDLAVRWRAVWPQIRKGFTTRASRPVDLTLVDITAAPVGDLTLPRDSTLVLRGDLPRDGSPVVFGWASQYGALVVRQGDKETGYSAYLTGGEPSQPLPREGVAQESAASGFARYVTVGFIHIVPKGLDHILFVLGLFFFALRVKPLLVQVTSFTLAHTATLALASLGYISVPAAIVEPLIAASIVYVAVENIFGSKLGWSRVAVVFGFGLLHGLGFAGVLSQIGVVQGRFVLDLVAFNIGVELGQLAVITGAFLTVGLWFGRRPWYQSRIAVPASAVIALVGAYWFVQRVFL